MFGSDWLANLFLSTFLFGLIFTVVSVALGFAGGAHVGHAQHDIDIHLGHSGEADQGGHDGPGILNMPTMMAFITWFGGIGYLLRDSLLFNGYLAAILALIGGLVGGMVMFALLARVL